MVSGPIAEHLLHHAEGVGDATASQQKDTGRRWRLFDTGEGVELIDKKTPSRRGEYLGKADQRRRRAVGGSDGLANKAIGKRRQVAHQPGSRHLSGRELDKAHKG